MSTRKITSIQGMTLVEAIIAIVLFTIVALAINESVVTFYRYNSYSIAQANQVVHARRGVEFLVRDIREMTYADDGSFPLISMGDHTISFYSDIDRDESVELVQYTLASTTLHKYVYDAAGFPPSYSTSSPTQTITISEYVQNIDQGIPTFVYYDENGAIATASTTVTDIRFVDVNVIVNIDPIRDPGQLLMRSGASLRNLQIGL